MPSVLDVLDKGKEHSLELGPAKQEIPKDRGLELKMGGGFDL